MTWITNSDTFVPFISGNSDLCSGVIQLFKDNDQKSKAETTVSLIVNDRLISSKSYESNLIVCILAVPSFIEPCDLLDFIDSYQKQVSHIRCLKDSAPNRYMAIFKFREQGAAIDFIKEFHGKQFTSMSPELCHVGWVRSIELKSISPDADFFIDKSYSSVCKSVQLNKNNGETSAGGSKSYELPTCPVCLERMDAAVSGVLTIFFACPSGVIRGRQFVILSLSCPVCRHTLKNNPEMKNTCGICGTNEDLWICLICGHIGHAYEHHVQTDHVFSLELETQRVWDYVGDGYVHRLVMGDGKLVELPGPTATSSSKVINIFLNMLLAHLESQRLFYEAQMDLMQSQTVEKISQLESSISNLNRINSEHNETIQSLSTRKKCLETKIVDLTNKLRSSNDELTFEKQINENLLKKVDSLKIHLKQKEEELKDVKEQLRDVMFYLNTQQSVENSSFKNELQTGQIVIEQKRGRTKNKKK
ncbi:BRCA1-associated 2 domain-containing protein [Rozella allomycis CSF55]|uniref:BRCA1-associated 2 domain-containing protein n=1 Tax=Rozella allomycis (strain CSF55) TaxID=988480 RepID=A0A075AWV1_ROZAC|nr:BRCA1-associated 2 domain-containing protein [Rozella allomycis CSF55]|eukprot:EPZ34732.1 BRCA1-associated 2 domain-containing protein [Rozella allomycis CSF55]